MTLAEKPSSAIVAVRDPKIARHFYTEVLGLEVADDHGDVFALRTGDTTLSVYKSAYAGTNKANAVVWDAGDEVDTIAASLRDKGIDLDEHPEGFDRVTDGVHEKDGFKAIWFKDPDGNILHVNSGSDAD